MKTSCNSCGSDTIEVHGHLQCQACGSIAESCCEGAPSLGEKEGFSWYIGKSKIHGFGAFMGEDVSAGKKIDEIAIFDKNEWFGVDLTELGTLVNHQKHANCELKRKEGDSIVFWLYSTSDMKKGEELVADYSKVPFPFSRDTRGFRELEYSD